MRVTIGIAYYDSFFPETVYALLHGIPAIPHDVGISMAGGPQVSQNREAIVTEALKAGSDRLVFVDTDMVFPTDGLARLLTHEHAVIGGMYHLKKLPLENAVKLEGERGEFFTGRITMPDHPIKCAIVPTGFLSLHLPTLIEKIRRPWFANGLDENGEIVTEDVMFCRAAQAAGLDLWCDPTIPLKHMGRFPY